MRAIQVFHGDNGGGVYKEGMKWVKQATMKEIIDAANSVLQEDKYKEMFCDNHIPWIATDRPRIRDFFKTPLRGP